jgi:hypothetical protein
MTLGEFRRITKDHSDNLEIEVDCPSCGICFFEDIECDIDPCNKEKGVITIITE